MARVPVQHRQPQRHHYGFELGFTSNLRRRFVVWLPAVVTNDHLLTAGRSAKIPGIDRLVAIPND